MLNVTNVIMAVKCVALEIRNAEFLNLKKKLQWHPEIYVAENTIGNVWNLKISSTPFEKIASGIFNVLKL